MRFQPAAALAALTIVGLAVTGCTAESAPDPSPTPSVSESAEAAPGTRANPLAVGETCEVTFRVGWMSQVFASGHCIRVTVSCTAFPLYETGGSGHSPGGGPAHGDHTDGTAESIGRVVHTLRHGGAHASHVLAPLIPAGDASSCVDVSGAFVADLARGAFPA